MFEIKDMTKLLESCRKYGVSHFKSPEFEFEMVFYGTEVSDDKPAIPKPVAPTNKISTPPVPPIEGMPTDDQMLYWSTDSMPDHDRETMRFSETKSE